MHCPVVRAHNTMLGCFDSFLQILKGLPNRVNLLKRLTGGRIQISYSSCSISVHLFYLGVLTVGSPLGVEPVGRHNESEFFLP